MEQRADLVKMLADHNHKGQGIITLLILSKLPPDVSIEDYAFAKIKEGASSLNEKQSRILIVVEMGNRNLRIQTTESSSIILSDEYCKAVIDYVMVPQFKQSEYFAGIRTGIRALIARLEQCSNDPKLPHIHLPLIAPDSILATEDAVDKLSILITEELLKSKSESSDNPLAPCSLLAAGLKSIQLNAIGYQLQHQGTVPLPPPGTNILGIYDKELKGGRIPREDPGITADIMARLFIWYSGGINARANTLIHDSTQQQCLALLTSDTNTIGSLINGKLLAPDSLVFTHVQAVANYSPTLSKPDAEKFLDELRTRTFQALSSQSTQNPLAPCALLKALRLSTRVNDLWASILTGKINSNDPLVEKFAQEVKGGTLPRDNPVRAAQIAAQLFGSQIVVADEFTDMLTSESTQQECLSEIFQPGLIRARLVKEGKFPFRP